MINLNIFKFTKSYCLMLIAMSIVGVGSFSACKKKKTVINTQIPDDSNVPKFTLKITKTGTGTITASWEGGFATDAQLTAGVKIAQGTKVTLTATAQSDNAYVLWDNTTKSKTLQITMDADKTIAVNIVYQYLLTVSKTGKGSVSASWTGGSATDAQLSAGVLVDENTAVTLTATPDATMPNVVWNGTIVGNTLPLTITANQQVSVAFSATPPTLFALDITQPLITEGIITAYSDATFTIPITDLTKIVKDAKVYIKVVPATGKKVTQLTGVDAGSANSDNTQATITMTTPKQITASFEIITYQLTLNAGDNGTIKVFTDAARTIPVADINKIPYNTKVYLQIIPNIDYRVSSLSGIDWKSNNSNNTQATITMTANQTIDASFTSNFNTLTISPFSNGIIQAYTDKSFTQLITDLTKIPYQTYVYLKITPNTECRVTALSGVMDLYTNADKTNAQVYMGGNQTISATITYNFEFTETATTATFIKYSGTSLTVTIPSTYNGKPVTAIGGSYSTAVFKPSRLSSVIIPNSVTSIGESAFWGCTGLTSITIPSSVISIGNNAFYGCENLTSVTIPDNVTTIGNSAFYRCIKLTNITIPNSVTSIGNSVFSSCFGLTSVTIGNQITKLGQFTFSGTKITNITIPNSVTSIDQAFDGCSELTSVTIIGNAITTIGGASFRDCSKLTTINLPNSITSVGASAFEGCSSLITTLPTNLTSVGASAFKGCGKITGTMTIPNGVTTIPNGAFWGCRGLTGTLTIPNSVTSIGYYAFSSCSGLTGTLTIPNSVTSIGGSAFYYCSGLTSITIGSGVTSIGNYPFFDNCTGLTSITVDATNTAYSSNNGVLFNKSKTILLAYPIGKTGTTYTIPNSVTSIDGLAFYGCTGLTSVIIPNSVTSIGELAFYGCINLNSVTIQATTPPTLLQGSNGGKAFENTASGFAIYVPSLKVSTYKTATYWSAYASKIYGY